MLEARRAGSGTTGQVQQDGVQKPSFRGNLHNMVKESARPRRIRRRHRHSYYMEETAAVTDTSGMTRNGLRVPTLPSSKLRDFGAWLVVGCCKKKCNRKKKKTHAKTSNPPPPPHPPDSTRLETPTDCIYCCCIYLPG